MGESYQRAGGDMDAGRVYYGAMETKGNKWDKESLKNEVHLFPVEYTTTATAPPTGYTADGTMGNATGNRTSFYDFYQTEQITFLCILFAFIVIGNSSVLVAIMLSKTRKSRMNFFIMQLAIADLNTGLVTVLTDILWKTTVEWHAGNVGCKLVRYMQSVATYASTYVLVALSIDRLDAIARPMNFSGSGRRAKILIINAWALAALFSIPMLVLNNVDYVMGIKQCWINMLKWQWMLYVTLLALAVFIFPAIIIAICYTVIVFIIWSKGSLSGGGPKPIKTRRFTKTSILNSPGKRRGNGNTATKPVCNSQTSGRGVIPKARIKTVKMTLVIVLVFICCWCPFFVFDLLDVYGKIPMSQRKVAIAIFIQSLATLNSAANPVIYCLFSTRICSNWRRLWLCDWLTKVFCRCCSGPPNPRNRRHSYSTGLTTEYSTVNDFSSRSSRAVGSRRHSGTPYVKVTLNEKENEILLKHIGKNGRNYRDHRDNDDTISAV